MTDAKIYYCVECGKPITEYISVYWIFCDLCINCSEKARKEYKITYRGNTCGDLDYREYKVIKKEKEDE